MDATVLLVLLLGLHLGSSPSADGPRAPPVVGIMSSLHRAVYAVSWETKEPLAVEIPDPVPMLMPLVRKNQVEHAEDK